MLVGVPKEIKPQEFRVGLVPSSVKELKLEGHEIYLQKDAGLGSGFSNQDYIDAGAEILDTAQEVFERATLIVKVKEPQKSELKMLNEQHILFTYLHLAPDPEQAKGLIESGCTAIAYETVTDSNGRMPLLAPMSEIAGKLAVHNGAKYLEKIFGGSGILIGGVPGVKQSVVLILGGGYAGYNAAKVASGMGAEVIVMDSNIEQLRRLDDIFLGKIKTIFSTKVAIAEMIKIADIVIGSIYVRGAKAFKLVTKEMLAMMKPGSVIIDIAIDQGGCFETSKPTTHENPIYIVDGIIHYCVANMPGAVPRTASQALNNATLPFARQIAHKGLEAVKICPNLINGLNIFKGKVTEKNVAKDLGYEYFDPYTLLENIN